MAIYKITNKNNGMIYIGQTTNPNPMMRIKKHFEDTEHNKFYLQNAIHRHGRENFSVYVLEDTCDVDLLNELEQYYIDFFNCLSPNGYNLKMGGANGGPCSEEVKQKISQAKKGKSNYKLIGRKFTKEHCDALSKVRKGFTSKARENARLILAQKMSHQIIAINSNTGESFEYPSIEKCSKELKLAASCISRVLRNDQNRKQHKGWTFVYKGKI